MRRAVAFLVASVFAAAAAAVAPVAAAPPGAVQMSVAPDAALADGGAAVIVAVTVSCAGGSDVLEAFVYVTQDGQQSRFVPIPVRCGGRARTSSVRVPAPEATTFHAGSASASGFVLVDRRGTVTSASPSQTLIVA